MTRKFFKLALAMSWVLVVVALVLSSRARHTYVAAQRDLAERAFAHLSQVKAAEARASAFRASHPRPTPAERKQIDDLNAETIRVMTAQDNLNSSMIAGPPRPSPFYERMGLAALILPALWTFWLMWERWQRAKRRARQQKNLCPDCDYDLRASPNRCPECGTAAGGDRAA